MEIDIVTLSRIQFALTIMFHYIFPPLSIGLGILLVIMEGAYMRTGKPVYEQLARFWTKIFAINFALGVATGIVMEFQFGTNWAVYSRYVGDVFGSALAAEGIFAFFLESGFLAILVFGWDRVGPRMHFTATVLVALGAIFSAVWIVIANSWQQTPAGFHLVGQGENIRAEITDFWAMVFNPSSVDRLVHTLLGAFILGAFFVLSVSAYYILTGRHLEFARRGFNCALALAVSSAVLILASGHHQAQVVAQYQPAKLAAFEGHYTTGESGATLYAFGVPNDNLREVRYGLGIPGMLSFLIHGNFTRTVPGLDQFPQSDWPPVFLSFTSYHLMVSLGMGFIALSLLTCWFWYRGTLLTKRWLLWIWVFAVAGPFIANEVGWVAAEVGRQPWVVYGLLRTEQGVSTNVGAGAIIFSILLFSVIYVLLFMIWVYVLDSTIRHGPLPVVEGGHETPKPHKGYFEAAGDAQASPRVPPEDTR